MYTANIVAIIATNTPADIPRTTPVDNEDLVGCTATADVGAETGEVGTELVVVITGLEESVNEGRGEAEGPSNKLEPRPTDIAVVPPVMPETEGTGPGSD